MIIVTGAAGFIGSYLVGELNQCGFKSIVAVDEFDSPEKNKNLDGLLLKEKVNRNYFFEWLDKNQEEVEFIFHIGARTDTTEQDVALLKKLNTEYTQKMWKACVQYQLPLVYASSAATYGNGEHGYADDEYVIPSLKPMNPYGQSKQDFDVWALAQKEKPFFWAGLKFFNVYGPNEYHKGRMASVVWHAYQQIKKTGQMKLFRSHRAEYEDGKQLRDFVYVKDVAAICLFLMHHRKNSGIYNVGSGKARSFLDLTNAVFRAMNKEPRISFIDIPADIRDTYQYFTEATMQKIQRIGFAEKLHSLEEGVHEYVQKLIAENR